MNPDDYFPYSYWEQLSEEQQDNFLAYMKFLGVNSYRFARKAPVFRPGMDSAGRGAALVVSYHYSNHYK